MPKTYKPFDVMKRTDAMERLIENAALFYGVVGPPYDHQTLEQKAAWLDLVAAAGAGSIEKKHRMIVVLTARTLSGVRRGDASKGTLKLLVKLDS